jgi:GDP-4-dehydro-6-deoxy-D-mannose reductase
MKKVLITGVTGFAGSHLAEYLVANQEAEIFGTYVSENGLKNITSIEDKIKLHKVDLTNQILVEDTIKQLKPDVVYHLAAFPSPAASFKDPASFMMNNINSELYLLEAIKNLDLQQTKILIISSSEVYGFVAPSDLPIDEDTPLRPVSPYGVSKIAQDFLGLQYALSYNLSIIRARPFGHVGPRLSDQFAASSFAKKIAEIESGKRDAVLTVGNLESKRDLSDVRDMVRAYSLLIEKGEKGEVYNIGSGTVYKIGDLLEKLLSFSSVKIEVKVDPALLRPSDIPELRCDPQKFQSITGWKPEIPFEKTLQDTLDYWRKVI